MFEINSNEFQKLLSSCCELAELFPDGVVFIGGIAVYMHCINHDQTREFAEFTHDADFYISLADMADLRDIEEVSPNRRLHKHQIIKGGFEFDIYTERHSSLIVPFDEVMANANLYTPIRVACLEHLLALKLEAYRDRRASSKGRKDAKDIIRLGLISHELGRELNPSLCIGYLSEEHTFLLSNIGKSSEFLSLAKGNAKRAKQMRDSFGLTIKSILAGIS